MNAMEKLLELSGWKGREKDSGEMFWKHPHSGVEYRFPVAALVLLYSMRTISPPPKIKNACREAFNEIVAALKQEGWEIEDNQASDPAYSSQYSFEIEEAFIVQVIRSAYSGKQDPEEPFGLN